MPTNVNRTQIEKEYQYSQVFKMESSSEMVTLYDPETDTIVEVVLSGEDAARVNRDMEFAKAVMNSAIQEKRNLAIAEQNLDDDQTATIAEEDIAIAKHNREHNQEDDQIAMETEAQGESEATDDCGSLYRWSPPCVLLLLETYRSMEAKFTNGKHSQKKCWEDISKVLKENGYLATGPQCSAKLRSLKKTYKSVKDHNNKSGNDRKTWQYFEIMDEIFSQKAWCIPVAVASSSGMSVVNGAREQGSGDSSASSATSKVSATALLQKRLKQKEEHELAKQKRHEEKLKMDQQLIDILAKLVENKK